MNIHGYKLKSKSITRLLREELDFPEDEKCMGKIRRLRRAKKDIGTRIRRLKDARDQKRRSVMK